MYLSIQVPAQDPSEQNPLEQLHLVWSANKAHHESFLTSLEHPGRSSPLTEAC